MARQSKLLTMAPELRNQIWDFALPAPPTFDLLMPWAYSTRCEVPAIAQVCRQTRAETLPMFISTVTVLLPSINCGMGGDCGTNRKDYLEDIRDSRALGNLGYRMPSATGKLKVTVLMRDGPGFVDFFVEISGGSDAVRVKEGRCFTPRANRCPSALDLEKAVAGVLGRLEPENHDSDFLERCIILIYDRVIELGPKGMFDEE